LAPVEGYLDKARLRSTGFMALEGGNVEALKKAREVKAKL
jgi:hypothetical protein